ncbi:MAG: helix-turn-helix domain-containing protein [Thiohalospira sp.]
MKRKNVYDKEGLEQFAQRLKKIRKDKSITQEELAFRSGLALSQIARIETARINPTLSTIFRIARTLNLKPSELFDFDLSPERLN